MAPQLEAFTLHLSAVMAALERRRQAGTLLTGACAAHEEGWCARYTARHAANLGQPAPHAAELGRAVGHNAFLMAARLALERLTTPLPEDLQFTADSPQADAYYAFVLAALELLRSPRPREDVPLQAEGVLEGDVRAVLARMEGPREGFAAAMTEAWEAVLASGALERRRAAQAAAAPAAAPAGAARLQRCALAACGAAEARPALFKSCAACRGVFYCCKPHQVAHWKAGHKAACKAAAKR